MSNERKKNKLSDILEEMNEIIAGMLESGLDLETKGDPLIWGISMSQKGNEPPEIREFGNMNLKEFMKMKAEYQPDIRLEPDIRRPLIDILEAEDTLHIVVDMPGVNKEDISLDSTTSMPVNPR